MTLFIKKKKRTETTNDCTHGAKVQLLMTQVQVV